MQENETIANPTNKKPKAADANNHTPNSRTPKQETPLALFMQGMQSDPRI